MLITPNDMVIDYTKSSQYFNYNNDSILAAKTFIYINK